ncbi:tetratricopeptide repeat protein [Bacteroidota bacterium]
MNPVHGHRKGKNHKRMVMPVMAAFALIFVYGQESGLNFPDLVLQDSLRAVSLYEQSKINFNKDSLDLALDLAVEALQPAMRSNQEDTEMATLLLIAQIYNRQDLPGDAIPYYMRVANILETRQDSLSLPDIYSSIAINYRLEEVYDKEGEYYLNALRLIPGAEHKERAKLNENIGIAIMQEGMLDSAVTYFKTSRSLLGETGKDDTRILNYLVQVHNRANQYEEALYYNEILFERYQDEQNFLQMSTLQNNIGYNYSLLGDYQNSVLSYRQAIDYGEKAGVPQTNLAYLMINTGICHQNMNEPEEARQYFQKALKLFEESGQSGEQSRLENILALIYYNDEDLYNAGFFSKKSIESAWVANDPWKLSDGYLTYSRILREGNDPIQALEYYEKYLNIRDSLQLENKLKEQELSQRRYQLEKSEKDLKIKLTQEQVKELAIQQLTLKLEREEQEKELIRKENDMQLLEKERLRQSLIITQQQYAVEQQEKENQILEQEKRITDLRLEKELRTQKQQEQEIILLEQEQQLDQLELARHKNAKKVLIWFIVLGFMITILIMGSLISSRKKNILLARRRKEIEEKNKDLEYKNEEISAQRDEIEAQRNMVFKQKEEIEQYNLEVMKSIEYARKIQASTLPDLSSLNTTISDFFIYFRPRDIVSGDFFWTANVENTTVLTVSDCTGHGVPGAFMSMLGMSLLKEIVQKEYITHPGVILRRLRKGIIAALGQKGISGEQRDGMDMALVTINHEFRSIQYAGAYNPLYLVRRKDIPQPEIEDLTVFEEEYENNYKLYEIRADKMPIGHFVHMDKFVTHELELMDGDNCYLFTDGYADQFGGPAGKKFKYKPFKRMLLQNAHLPMEQQKQILNETLEKWMKDIEQVDDICMMGLRFDEI